MPPAWTPYGLVPGTNAATPRKIQIETLALVSVSAFPIFHFCCFLHPDIQDAQGMAGTAAG